MKFHRTFTIPREPDFVIGDKAAPYLRRWFVIPRNRFLNIYLHNILRSDDDRALHDHPWASCSIILKGGYLEHMPERVKWRTPGSITFRRASAAHRLVIVGPGCWTLFITGPRIRQWGFHCPQGWRHWREFIGVPTGEARGDERGIGCGEYDVKPEIASQNQRALDRLLTNDELAALMDRRVQQKRRLFRRDRRVK